MFHLRLYSPVNFVIGLQVWVAQRSRLDLQQSLAEAERESPRWAYRLAATLLTGLLLGNAVLSALPRVADPAIQALSRAVSGRQAAVGVAALVTAFALWFAVAVLRRAWVFYSGMCKLGYAARARG